MYLYISVNVLKEIPNSSNSENNTLDLNVCGTVRNYLRYTVRQYKIFQSSIVYTFPMSLRKATQRISPSNLLNSLKFALLKFAFCWACRPQDFKMHERMLSAAQDSSYLNSLMSSNAWVNNGSRNTFPLVLLSNTCIRKLSLLHSGITGIA